MCRPAHLLTPLSLLPADGVFVFADAQVLSYGVDPLALKLLEASNTGQLCSTINEYGGACLWGPLGGGAVLCAAGGPDRPAPRDEGLLAAVPAPLPLC